MALSDADVQKQVRIVLGPGRQAGSALGLEEPRGGGLVG